MVIWIVLAVVIGVLALWLIATYNSLVKSKVQVEEAWSDITVQLKRRYDLIPNIVNTVKGYAAHEKQVFEEVTAARANALNAQTVKEAAVADNQFQAALKSLFAVAEAYPDLKANQNFQHLQEELVGTEDKIQASRRFYNGSARDLNVKLQTFPINIANAFFHFKQREFFEVEEGERAAVEKPVDVKF